tara:strand:- start:107 stop:484 length:378 start_codon:yes stop_codon:yes gene_type:complete
VNKLEFELLQKFYDRSVKNGEPITPRYITGEWENVFSSEFAKNAFSAVNKHSNPDNFIQHDVTKEDIVSRMHSVSVVASASEEEKEAFSREIYSMLESHKDTKGVEDGHFKLVYKSDIAYVTKTR